MSLGVMFGLLLLVVSAYGAEFSPPNIIRQAGRQVYFKSGERTELLCEATGEPQPSYTWYKNGLRFNYGSRVYQVNGKGTLVFDAPLEEDQGIFQCFAANTFGNSASDVTDFKMAMLDEYVMESPESYRPYLGDSLTIPCYPPNSVPEPEVFWAITNATDETFSKVIYNDRVTMDGDYNLRFTDVKLEDQVFGSHGYVCYINNTFARKLVRGPLNTIELFDYPTERTYPAELVWSNTSSVDSFDLIGMRGEEVTVQCVFSGNPTPLVTWRKVGGELPKHVVFSFFTLTFHGLKYEDAGEYYCQGMNQLLAEPVRRSFRVYVYSKPYFLVGEEPRDQEVIEGTDVVFDCNAKGDPETIDWFINTEPLNDVVDPRFDGRLSLEYPGRLYLDNVKVTDNFVVQCNITNVFGYVFYDMSLNVVLEKDEYVPGKTNGAPTLHSRDLACLSGGCLAWLMCVVFTYIRVFGR